MFHGNIFFEKLLYIFESIDVIYFMDAMNLPLLLCYMRLGYISRKIFSLFCIYWNSVTEKHIMKIRVISSSCSFGYPGAKN